MLGPVCPHLFYGTIRIVCDESQVSLTHLFSDDISFDCGAINPYLARTAA
jgi:hypothetical protein